MEKISKETFKFRVLAGFVMSFAWTVSNPIFKTYYGLLDAAIFGVVGVWVALVGLSQGWLRKKFTVKQMLTMLVVFDIFFVVATSLLVNMNIKWLLLFELLADGPYFALLNAHSAKLKSLYLGKFKPETIEKISNKLTQKSIWVNLFGLASGAVLGWLTQDIMVAVLMRNILIIIGIIFELKAIKA